jgi:hypothetical protein
LKRKYSGIKEGDEEGTTVELLLVGVIVEQVEGLVVGDWLENSRVGSADGARVGSVVGRADGLRAGILEGWLVG